MMSARGFERLRERVEVLEKIVTDKKFRLSDEIADLERQAWPNFRLWRTD